MSFCRAIQNDGRKNLFQPVLQSERAALCVVAAAGRTLLGDEEGVLSGNRCIRSHDGLEPEEILVRLSTNHTFYSSDRRYRHLICSYPLSKDCSTLQSFGAVMSSGAWLPFFDSGPRLFCI